MSARWHRLLLSGVLALAVAIVGCTPASAPRDTALVRLGEMARKARERGFFLKSRRIWKPATKDSPIVATAALHFYPAPDDTLMGGHFHLTVERAGRKTELWYLGDSAIYVDHADSTVKILPPEEAPSYGSVGMLRVVWKGVDTARWVRDSVQWEDAPGYVALRHPDEPGKEGVKRLVDTFYVGPDGDVRKIARHYEWLFMKSFSYHLVDSFRLGSQPLAPRYPSEYSVERLIKPAGAAEEASEETDEEAAWMAKITQLEGQEAPDFMLHWLSGDSAPLSSMKGRFPVILDFWYVGCYWCSKAAPTLAKLYENYREKGLRVIGVNPYDGPEEIKKYHDYMELPYPVARIDPSVPPKYNVMGYPTFIMIGRDGRIFRIRFGYADSLYDKLSPLVDTLVGSY